MFDYIVLLRLLVTLGKLRNYSVSYFRLWTLIILLLEEDTLGNIVCEWAIQYHS